MVNPPPISAAPSASDEPVAPAAISPARAWLLCVLLFFSAALCFLDRQVLSVLAPQIIAEFGMSNTSYSRVVFAFVLSYTIMLVLGGRVLDALGTRRGLTLAEEVLGDHREVVRRTRGNEQDRIVVTDRADLADRGLGALEHAPELLAAMAVLEDPDAGAIEIEQRSLSLAQHGLGESGGPRGEVELPRQRRSSQ